MTVGFVRADPCVGLGRTRGSAPTRYEENHDATDGTRPDGGNAVGAPEGGAGGGTRHDGHLREGRRADLLQELRGVSPADDVRADVALDVRSGAALRRVEQ